jgi:IMP dehydrogenase/GMP reductase
MALVIPEVSRTFNEFLLLPNRTRTDCLPESVDLSTALVRHEAGQAPSLTLDLPFTSAIMQAVSSPELAIALAECGGLGFLHHNQPIADQAAQVWAVKSDVGARDLPVGAGVNTHDYADRIPALVAAGADVLCLDSSDGYSDWQTTALAWVKQHYPDVPVGAGNVVDAEAFTFLAEAGADFVKVGVGGGSICITRDQKGIGRGQASALLDVATAREEHCQRTGQYVPVCSDGGLMHDYHIALALAMGADFVMMGRYFARFDQSPGARVVTEAGVVKEYWGEGSSRARNWQRYGHGGRDLAFEEGVDGLVPYAGDLRSGLALTIAKLRATMVSCGSVSLAEFRSTARLTLVSAQSFAEGHPSVLLPVTSPVTGTGTVLDVAAAPS